MLLPLAKIAANLDIDKVLNTVMEGLYSNARHAKPRFARRFQVLAYHKVSPDRHPFFEPVHPDVFDQQMHFLSRCYRVMPLAELMERNRRGEVPHRAVAITFDDGYRDNYDYAFPILKKYRLPATIFVTTGVIETGKILWHDRIFDSFRFTRAERAWLPHRNLPELKLHSLEARHSSLPAVLAAARSLYGEAQLRFVKEIENALKPEPDECVNHRMLTWKHIQEMHAQGIDFGSHTVSHPILSRIPADELLREIRESKRQLSERLGSPITTFAYPNGHAADYNNEVKAALREAGYSCAVTSRWGCNTVFSDPFEIRRGQPWHKQIELFRLAFFLQRHGLN